MVVAKIVKSIYPNISHRFSGIFRQIIINKTLITLSKFSYFLKVSTPLFSCFKIFPIIAWGATIVFQECTIKATDGVKATFIGYLDNGSSCGQQQSLACVTRSIIRWVFSVWPNAFLKSVLA